MNPLPGVRQTPHELALLRGGPCAAVTVAVVSLYLRGAVVAGAPGTMLAVESEAGDALPELPPPGVALDPPPELRQAAWAGYDEEPPSYEELPDAPEADLPDDPVGSDWRALYLESAVYQCLHEPSDLRELVRDPVVKWAVAEVRVGLAAAGLVGWPALWATRAARRRLRVLRKAYPVPASRRGLPDHAKLLAVALHGEPALRVLVPRFALRAGLVPRAEVRDRGMLRHHPRGGTGNGGGVHYCGGGGGGGGD
ncbi:hypothetical protein GCM10009601_23330 [Streptomyces thermospinosisporus]|uniref:TIGR04222 domain-containing membrane protein n=1 Tax=Streptomyces thermospinosisporus TaxID=161482 RepID=A0ABN1YTD7_9ACTN